MTQGSEGPTLLLPTLSLPDPDDRHVMAAAIQAGAAILSFNLADFPPASLAGHGVQAHHPDDFLLAVLKRFPEAAAGAMQAARANLKAPPMTPAAYADSLARAGLPKTAATVRAAFLLRI